MLISLKEIFSYIKSRLKKKQTMKRIFGLILFALYIVIAMALVVGIVVMTSQAVKTEGTDGLIALGISILFMVAMFYGLPKLIKHLLEIKE